MEARHWIVGGLVQAVGFRPFVHRIATRHDLRGWVRNRAGNVEIFAEGAPASLDRFADALLAQAPPLARPVLCEVRGAEPANAGMFEIRDSAKGPGAGVHISPDQPPCADCLTEMADPGTDRFGYPFINCTQCGPRYTLIEKYPYDRANTGMTGFPLCGRCAAEYASPSNRRFHAEPTACPDCGPQIYIGGSTLTGPDALAAAVKALHHGQIVAVKGVGGYHLICDAQNASAIARLRQRKHRQDKPLAVLFPANDGFHWLRCAVALSPVHLSALQSTARPIVLMNKHANCPLPATIALGLKEIGAKLPDSPLQYLLSNAFGAPLVATSGNISGEPVLTEATDAAQKLGAVADMFLHHNRPILRPADDPVQRVIAGKARPFRLGRGEAPLEISLPFALPHPVLAFGGQNKTTITLAWDRRAVISQHIGDTATLSGHALLLRTAEQVEALYGVTAKIILTDAHPGYRSTRWLRNCTLPMQKIFHHEAHASALIGESPHRGDAIVFTWDGAGYGRDGTICGGEVFIGHPGAWRRVGSLRPFACLGGDRVARSPWRSALALCWEAGIDWPECPYPTSLLRQAWDAKLNCPPCSSIGRFFDAAASLIGLVHETTYEGQAAMLLESLSDDEAEPVKLALVEEKGVVMIDWATLLPTLLDAKASQAQRADIFHSSLAAALIAQARAIRGTTGLSCIGLTGGVFQNRRLTEQVIQMAAADNFDVLLSECVPCNDAGLSFGQVVEFGWRQ